MIFFLSFFFRQLSIHHPRCNYAKKEKKWKLFIERKQSGVHYLNGNTVFFFFVSFIAVHRIGVRFGRINEKIFHSFMTQFFFSARNKNNGKQQKIRKENQLISYRLQMIFGVGNPSARQVILIFWFSRTATDDGVLSMSRIFGGTNSVERSKNIINESTLNFLLDKCKCCNFKAKWINGLKLNCISITSLA